MLQELIVLSLAAGFCWEVVRYFWPGYIPVRLAPLLVASISYGLTFFYHQSVILAMATTGGVALFHKLLDTEPPEPLKINWKRNPRRHIDRRHLPVL